MRRSMIGLSFGAAVLIVAAFMAGRAVVSPRVADTPESGDATYTVAQGYVERSLDLAVTASWSRSWVGDLPASGVVTALKLQDGLVGPVDVGDELLQINLVPVFVLEGTVPSFRDLTVGSEGADVAQLQAGLAQLGYSSGLQDGKFDGRVSEAVRKWQKSRGLEVTGSVSATTLMFVPNLPAVMSLGEDVQVGRDVSALEDRGVYELAAGPEFKVVLAEGQNEIVRPGMQVEVSGPSGQMWLGTVSSVTKIQEQNAESFVATVTAPDGASVCGGECAVVPNTGTSSLMGRILIVPRTDGPVVPVAALRTKPDGTVVVVMSGKEERSVTVAAQANGIAVVPELLPGEVVLLPEPK